MNPRPEEDPSFGSKDDLAPEATQGQTCDENPSLPSCVRDPVDVSDDNGPSDADEEEASPGNSSGAPAAPPAPEDASVARDAGSEGSDPDAGVDR